MTDPCETGIDRYDPTEGNEQLYIIEGREGPFFDPRLNPLDFGLHYQDIEQWPDQTYVFDTNKLLGTDTYTASSESRLRAVHQAITGADSYNQFAYNPFPDNKNSIIKLAATTRQYLHKSSSIHGQRIAYHEILDPYAVFGMIEQVWQVENSPILQALTQLRATYSDHLGRSTMEELAIDVICATQQNTIKQLYENCIRAYRNQ